MDLSDFGVTKHASTLPGGTPLVFFERQGSPVSIQVGFRAGSSFDPITLPGLAHFCEHMVVSGTEKYPTKDLVGEFAAQRGAYLNASTGPDVLYITFNFGDPNDLEAVGAFLDQLLKHSLFERKTIDNERGAIQAELSRSTASPSSHIGPLWRQVAYQQTPAAHHIIGTDESLQAIQRSDLISYYRNMLTAANAGIVVSGDIESKRLEELLATVLPPEHAVDQVVSLASSARQDTVLVAQYPGSPQAHLSIGFPTVGAEHPDNIPLMILGRIYGNGKTSRLYRRLRLETGLVYGVGAYQMPLLDSGRWNIGTDCRKPDIDRVMEIIAGELEAGRQGDITVSEFELAKNSWLKAQRLTMDSSVAWTKYHLRRAIRGDIYKDIASDMNEIQNVTLEDIRRVAATYLLPDRWYLAVCGDFPNGVDRFPLPARPSK